MSYCIYLSATQEVLHHDEMSWTKYYDDSALFVTRNLAEQIAARELGPLHCAIIFNNSISD